MMTFSKSSTLRQGFTFTVDATETFNNVLSSKSSILRRGELTPQKFGETAGFLPTEFPAHTSMCCANLQHMHIRLIHT